MMNEWYDDCIKIITIHESLMCNILERITMSINDVLSMEHSTNICFRYNW